MDTRNLDKAMELFAKLIVGEPVNEKENSDLYETWRTNAQVYDILDAALKKSNLDLYEHENGLYISAGEGNRVFGFTNEELKRAIGLRLNRELYLAYFVIYNMILLFYAESGSPACMDYVKEEDVIAQVNASFSRVLKDLHEKALNEIEENSFQVIGALWEDMPMTAANDDMSTLKAARGSKVGFVKLVFNFLISQELFFESEGRYYAKPRFRAVTENYYAEYRGRLYTLINEGGREDAPY